MTASSLIMLPLVLSIDRPWTLAMPGTAPILAVVALGILSTGLAYVLFFQVMASAGATNLSLVTFLIPVSAIAFGVLLLGERLKTEHIFGMALIALGLLAIDGRALRLLQAGGRDRSP